jgi:hypothetical protein
VELHNYYILNWKKIDVIVVKYRQSHFLTDDGVFINSLSDLCDSVIFEISSSCYIHFASVTQSFFRFCKTFYEILSHAIVAQPFLSQ